MSTSGTGGLDGDSIMSNIQLPVITTKRPPWNKGRLVGQKRPLLPKQVWGIRARLELADNLRDLALFNLSIDSKLRGCDLVSLRVVDLVVSGSVRERVSVIQSKTGRPVQFEVSENTRKSVLEWVDSLPCAVASFFSQAGSTLHCTCRRGSTLGSSGSGCQPLGSTRQDTGHIPCGAPKPP